MLDCISSGSPSGGDSVAVCIVSLLPHLLGSRSPPVPLHGDSSALNKFNQTSDGAP